MKKIVLLFIAATFLTLSACGDAKKNDKENTETFWVNSFKQECDAGAAKKNCLMVTSSEKIEGNTEWEFFYSAIENFKFKPGYFQQIKVEKTALETEKVPADASMFNYKLIEVLNEQKDARYALHDLWVAEKVNDTLIPEGVTHPRLEINLTKMTIFGSDGCNNYRGSISQISEREIKFEKIALTQKMCLNMKVATQYNKALLEAVYYNRNELELSFFNKDNQEILQFKKVD